MKIILKPAGIALVGGGIVLLAGAALLSTRPKPAVVQVPSSTPTPVLEEKQQISVDMTDVGKRDWVLWRDPDSSKAIRKAGVRPAIGTLEFVGAGAIPFHTGLRTFRWQDGTPEKTGESFGEGLRMQGGSTTFKFSVPAAPGETRILRVYCGTFRSIARFKATMSDGSVPERIENAEWQGTIGHTAWIYTVHFRARKPGDVLTVSWSYTGGGNDGYFTIQGAALE